MSEVKKRGRKPLPKEQLAITHRKNVSLDAEAQQALSAVSKKLERELGFKPTLTQTVLWLTRTALGEKE